MPGSGEVAPLIAALNIGHDLAPRLPIAKLLIDLHIDRGVFAEERGELARKPRAIHRHAGYRAHADETSAVGFLHELMLRKDAMKTHDAPDIDRVDQRAVACAKEDHLARVEIANTPAFDA